MNSFLTTVPTVLLASGEEGATEETHNPLLPEWYDIIWSMVAFVVVGAVFWKFVLPRFNELMAQRSEQIEGGIANAEAAQAEAAATLAAYKEQLAGARTEASVIREEARTQGQQIIADMKVTAQAESDRIVAAGENQLQAQRQAVVGELRSELGKTSVDLAEKLVGQSLSEEVKQADSIDRFLAELDASPTR